MKQKIRLVALGAFAAVAGQSFGEDVKLYVQGNDTEGKVVSSYIVGLDSKLRFSAEGVNVYNGDAPTATFSYADIASLSFSYQNLSEVVSVADDSGLRLRKNPVEDSLEIIGFSGVPVSLTVTDLKGAVRVSCPQWQGETVAVDGLSSGLYFVTINQKTLKFIKK